MKKIALRCFAAVAVLICALAIASCSKGNPYSEYDKEGKNISIKYLANGGIINSGADTVVDVFSKNESGVYKLLAPESSERGKSQVTLSHGYDHQFAGWYVAVPVVDANGNALDADGNLVSESGKDPAYTAGKRWDFETDRLTIDLQKTYSANDPVLTLIAMWTPKFTFEIYAKGENDSWELINSKDAIALNLPKWSNGKINMMDFPAYPDKDMTFKAAYADEAMTTPITSQTISGEIDYEHGVVREKVVKIYTEWYEGTWFMIENASQLYSNARATGNYILLNDIDMSGENWPVAFSQRNFVGKFYGNGHKISNVNANQQGNYKLDAYGLFGSIGATAEFHDITFENISYSIAGALNDASFGLFAGEIADGVIFENVTISGGKLIISDALINDEIMSAYLTSGMFEIGQLFGYGSATINTSGISCELETENSNIEINVSDTGAVSITFLQQQPNS